VKKGSAVFILQIKDTEKVIRNFCTWNGIFSKQSTFGNFFRKIVFTVPPNSAPSLRICRTRRPI